MNTKEKAVLRQVPQGVIATVDRIAREDNNVLIDDTYLATIESNLGHYSVCKYSIKMIPAFACIPRERIKLVIASTFGAGKKLMIDNRGKYMAELLGKTFKDAEFNQPYEYTETDNSIIIKL